MMKITEVRVQSFRQPVAAQWQGPFGAKQEITLTTVVTEEGIEGYGSGRSQAGGPGAVLANELAEVVRPQVVGMDALDRERIWQKLWSLGVRTRLSAFAMSCLDVALWDIAGKKTGLPIHKLLGNYRDKVPAYASSGHHKTIEAYVEEGLAYKARGFPAYKLHPFGIAKKDVELCKAVRKALGDDIELMIDPVGAYDHREALWVGRRLEELSSPRSAPPRP